MIVDRAMIKDHADREPGGPQQRRSDSETGAQRTAGERLGEPAPGWLVGDEPAADDAADPRAKAERLPIAPPAGRQAPPCRPVAADKIGRASCRERVRQYV